MKMQFGCCVFGSVRKCMSVCMNWDSVLELLILEAQTEAWLNEVNAEDNAVNNLLWSSNDYEDFIR